MTELAVVGEDGLDERREGGALPRDAVEADSAGEVLALLERMKTGDRSPEALQEFQRLLPRSQMLTAAFGDLAKQEVEEFIRAIAPQPYSQVALLQHVSGLRDSLGYGEASVLEQGLVDHVVMCWLRLWRAERRYSAPTEGSLALADRDLAERQLSAAQTRYLRAVEALARVRRLSARVVQVNIAEKQLNIQRGLVG